MHGNDLPNILNVISILIALGIVIVAGRTLSEAGKTTGKLSEAVTELKSVVQAEQAAVSRLEQLLTTTKEALEQARTAASEADQRARDAAERAETSANAAAERDRAATERATARDREIFLERRYERVLSIGQLVEEIFWAIKPYNLGDDVPKHLWNPQRNALRHRMTGFREVLPYCQRIIDAGTADQAIAACPQARQEVEVELQRIDVELAGLRTAG